MKKLLFILSAVFILSPRVFAEPLAIDVFEEYASFDDEECKSYGIDIATEANTTVSNSFLYSGNDICAVEITSYPHYGALEVNGAAMEFSYTPNKDFSGNDCFYYRVSNGVISSNISKCTIKTKKERQNASTGFYYTDMTGNPGEYAALKMVELDILKGEKIGRDYYFYPKAQVSRGMAISCISRADKYNSKASCEVKQVFADASSLSDQLKSDVYYATGSGIINGIKSNGEYYLRLNDTITRAEFFCMIDRAMSAKTDTSTDLLYADKAQIPDYASVSIKNLVSKKILPNSENSLLRPNDALTKEEMAQLLYKFVRFNEQNTVKTMAQEIRENLYSNINI